MPQSPRQREECVHLGSLACSAVFPLRMETAEGIVRQSPTDMSTVQSNVDSSALRLFPCNSRSCLFERVITALEILSGLESSCSPDVAFLVAGKWSVPTIGGSVVGSAECKLLLKWGN